MKIFLTALFLAILCFPGYMFGQEITGTVLSANDSLPVSGATVRILGMDSKLIKGGTSNSNGVFALSTAGSEQMNVVISFIGFETEQISIKGTHKSLNLGKIYLKENAANIGEVVVEAKQRINKVDKSIIIPSASQLKVSNSSLSLLQNLSLPGLRVDLLEQNISINGGQPIYMIDGVVKTKHDVLSVNPKNIARIEYEDAPSIRDMDKNAGGVINVILKEKENGGNFWSNIFGSPMTGFLNTNVYFAYNWAKSELSVNYFNDWRNYTHRKTDKDEKYISPAAEYGRDFAGVCSPFGYLSQGLYLNYTYQHDKNTMFSATFRNDFGKQHTSVNGEITDTQQEQPYYRDSKSTFDAYIPALDLFFKRGFKNNQFLEINVVGTYQNTDYERTLKDNSDVYTNEIYNSIDNTRKSLISEVVYRKSFKKVRLNLGYQNLISSSENKYKDASADEEKLTQNNNYIYGSLSGALGKFSYRLGSGIKLFTVKNDEDKMSYVKNHSTLTLMYGVNDNFDIKLTAFYTPHLPGLSQLSNVTQRYDELLQMKGNPDLKAAHTVGSKLFANYQKSKFNTSLSLSFQRRVNTIYTDVQPLDGNTFISQPKNDIGDNHFNAEYKCSYTGLWNHVNLFATAGLNSYQSEGHDFKHHLNNFYWDFSAQIYWGKWTLSGYYAKPQKSLVAETIDLGDNNSQVSLGFKHKNLNVLAAVKYPFDKRGWKWGEESLSKVNPGSTHVYIRDNGCMLVLGLSYSLNFGKGLKKLSKSLNNIDSTSNILKVQE
jgi:hypothetical protein